MEAGDVIRWAFVQADGRTKLRPAILLKRVPPFNDWVICAVSTQVHRYRPGLDILLDIGHPDLKRAGLPFASVIRTAYLTTIPEQRIDGSLGRLSPATMNTLYIQLKHFLSE